MKKRLAALFAVLVLTLASLGLTAAPALADDRMPTVEVDFDAGNGDYGDYRVDDDSISLLKTDVMYKLSGSTGKQIVAENAGVTGEQYFYLHLDKADLEEGVTARDGDNFNLCIEVAENGFVNYAKRLKAVRLYIAGNGFLAVQDGLDVGPVSANSPMAAKSCFCVQDAQIDVGPSGRATTSCVWKGYAELSGAANVTYTSAGDYAPLRVENTGKAPAALTIKDDASLHCLQLLRDQPSSTYVDGLQVGAGKVVLSDDAHLEAVARPLEGGLEGEGGAAIFCAGDIEITGSAMLEAYGAGKGMHCMGSLSISGQGARVDASATDGCGILLELGMKVSDGALVATDGHLEALNVCDDVTVDNAFLVATSETGTTFAADNSSDISFTLSNSHVELSAAEGCDVFQRNFNATVDNCWVNVAAGNIFNADVANSVLFVGDEGTVIGDARISYGAEVGEGQTLTIPEGTSLTLASDTVFSNDGKVIVRGTFNGDEAEIECTNHCGGAATCSSLGICDVCHAEYLDPHNHANLVRVEAKAATAAAEGNIEYWFCSDCGKYFSDAACEHEISQASTVIAKLPDAPKPAADKTVTVEKKTVTSKVAAGKTASARLVATGDASAVFAMVAVLLGCGCIAAAAVACKRH